MVTVPGFKVQRAEVRGQRSEGGVQRTEGGVHAVFAIREAVVQVGPE